MLMPLPTLADVLTARRAIRDLVIETPLVPSALSERLGCEALLKLESLQRIGAFKIRGAANAVANLTPEQAKRGVVCCSTGNHGRAVAYAAKAHGIKAIVCLSRLVPTVKVNAIEALGAEVRRIGNSQDDAQIEVDRLVRNDGMTDLPPFDHPHVIAGQATVGLELLEARPDLETIVVPLSGGGLAGGIALAAKAIKPTIKIIGISMDRGAAMAESLKAGKPIEVEEVASLADSLGGGIGLQNELTFRLCKDLIDQIILVTEDEIYDGMRCLYREDRQIAEGGCAVGHAAVLAGKLTDVRGPAAFLISGRNVDVDLFTDVITGKPVVLGDTTVTGNSYA